MITNSQGTHFPLEVQQSYCNSLDVVESNGELILSFTNDCIPDDSGGDVPPQKRKQIEELVRILNDYAAGLLVYGNGG